MSINQELKGVSENLQLAQLNERQTESTTSLWEFMPDQVFRNLFRDLSVSTVKNIRQVCSIWKHEMDVEVGLKVKIDGRISENIDFIKKISVLEARILHLEDPVPENLFSSNLLEKLILVGSVSPIWFHLKIPMFTMLKKLVLRGGFLTSHEIGNYTDFSSPLPSDAYQIILLPSLKSLEIMVNEFAYPFFLPLAIRLRDPERASINEQRFNEMALRVGQNISTLLITIRSPVLKMCQVYSYQKIGHVLPPTHNWRFNPLETFLECHKGIIQELYLPEFEGKYQNGHVAREFPNKLSKISIMLSGFMGDRDEGQPQDTTYWTELLSSQCALKAIELHLVDMSSLWLNNVLTSLCSNCRGTLSYIELLIQMDEHFEISCSVFQSCSSLEILRLSCRENEGLVTNFTDLPSSLKKIRMTACYILVPNQDEIKKFTNLIMLEMSFFMLDGQLHQQTLAAVQEFLRLRNLNYVGISFNESAGDNPKLREILHHFSLFYDPRFEYSGIKINFYYELQEGWSDEVFDEPDTDRDFTTQREPEDMPSWNSTPSSMDDDPRIIMFQNIPLLLRQINNAQDEHDEFSMNSNSSDTIILAGSDSSDDDDW